jgi:hypothetical protein
MNPFRRIGDLFRRKPGMIGTPPSERPLWHDPAAHARDFSARYAEDLDLIVAQRIADLGIPEHQNGRPDPDAGGRWRAFFPHQADGGGVVGDQINADAGLFDMGLIARRYGPEVGGKWAKDRLRDRLDQVIAHEHAEATGIEHTKRPFSARRKHLWRSGRRRGRGSARSPKLRSAASAAETRDGVPSLDE